MKVSKHAEMRLKERCGLQKKSCERIALKAYTEGFSRQQTKGRLNKWVTKVYYKNDIPTDIRIYGDKAFIFGNEVLITVLQVPTDLTKDLKKMVV